MEPTLSKPVRKRRRWLLVAFVLMLLSLVSWWLWPRMDQRLIGEWVLQPGYEHDYTAIRIRDDGTFETYALPNDLLTGLMDQKLSCYTGAGYLSIRSSSLRLNSFNNLWQTIKAVIVGERSPLDTHYRILEIDATSFLIRNNDMVLPFRRVVVTK